MTTTNDKSPTTMTLEEFVNEHLCPAGVVTRWDAEQIALAVRLGDTVRLRATLERLCAATGVNMPREVTLPDGASMTVAIRHDTTLP